MTPCQILLAFRFYRGPLFCFLLSDYRATLYVSSGGLTHCALMSRDSLFYLFVSGIYTKMGRYKLRHSSLALHPKCGLFMPAGP